MEKVLSQKAFDVYCDEVLRDAVTKNDQLGTENKLLSTAKDFLVSFRMYRGLDGLVKEINLHNDGNLEDANGNLIFTLETPIEVALEELRNLRAEIAGISCDQGIMPLWGNSPSIAVNEQSGMIQMEYSLDRVSFSGWIQNVNGTVEQVKDMVDGNRHTLFFQNTGMVDVETGQPSRGSQDDYILQGASFSLQTIKIARELVQSILDLKFAGAPDEDRVENNDRELQELQLLSQVDPNREDLVSTANQRKTLQTQNLAMKLSRDLLQFLEVYHPGGSLHLKLENGVCGNMVTWNGDVEPAWVLDFPDDAECRIPVHLIDHMRIKLSSIPFCNPMGPLSVHHPMFSRDGAMFLKYGRGVTAVFVFDESLDTIDLDSIPGGLLRYIHYKLVTSSPNVTANYRGPEFPGLSMRLACLQIELQSIKDHLDILSINYEEEEDDEGQEEEKEEENEH